jgi:archaemetzincin
MHETLYLVPIGEVEREILDYLSQQLDEIYRHTCEVAAPLAQPSAAYDEHRGQYLSSYILDQLARVDLPHPFRVLGVADLDLYVPELNFVFGQASKGGRDAVIGLPRLRQSFYGLPGDEELFRQRVLKEAVHELGHTLSLGHCPHRHWVMHFSNSLADTDLKEPEFCPRCRVQPAGGR